MESALSPDIEKLGIVNDGEKVQSKMQLRKRKAIDYSCSSKNIDNGGSKDCGKMNDIENNFSNEESEGYTSELDKSDKNHEKSYESKKRKASERTLNQNQSCELVDPSLIIKAPYFEVLNYEWDGEPHSRLFIFTSSIDKRLCYDYAWCKSQKLYICNRCRMREVQKHINAKIQTFPDGEKYAKLNNPDHRCNPVKYDPDKYNFSIAKPIVKPPNYEITTSELGEPINS